MSTGKLASLIYLTVLMMGFALAFSGLPIFGPDPNKSLFLGLTFYDLILLLLCPGAAALGLAVSNEIKRASDSLEYEINSLAGFALGLVVALYFVGAITDSISSVARILALCILLGYQAPNIWQSQEAAIKRLVDKKLKQIEKEPNK